jgi:hypothetical protein
LLVQYLNATPFACGSLVLADHFVCGFFALRAEKPHTIEK